MRIKRSRSIADRPSPVSPSIIIVIVLCGLPRASARNNNMLQCTSIVCYYGNITSRPYRGMCGLQWCTAISVDRIHGQRRRQRREFEREPDIFQPPHADSLAVTYTAARVAFSFGRRRSKTHNRLATGLLPTAGTTTVPAVSRALRKRNRKRSDITIPTRVVCADIVLCVIQRSPAFPDR